MSEQQFQKLMRQYQDLTPRDEFTAWSRRAILTTERRKSTFLGIIWREAVENLKFSLALSLTSVFLLVVFGGFSYWNSLLPNSGSRDLFTEAEQINQNLDIELGEANYFYNTNDDIAVILQEIRDTNQPTPTHEATPTL